jgi:hypothetical protein
MKDLLDETKRERILKRYGWPSVAIEGIVNLIPIIREFYDEHEPKMRQEIFDGLSEKGVLTDGDFIPIIEAHVISILNGEPAKPSKRYGLLVPNRCVVGVALYEDGEIRHFVEWISSATKGHIGEVMKKATKELKPEVSRAGGNKKGSLRKTDEYLEIAERYYSSGLTDTQFLAKHPGVEKSKLDRAKRRARKPSGS